MNKRLTYFYVRIVDIILVKFRLFLRNNRRCKSGLPVLMTIFVYITFPSSLQAQYPSNNRTNTSQTTTPYKKPLYFAIKNNLLYDAVLLPNLTAEVYLGNKWSLALEGNLSWWMFSQPTENEWFHRIQTAGLELRKWVCSPFPLYGHAVGVYAMIGNYDVRAFTKDEFSKGWLSYHSWSAGITYSYSIPISMHFNLEFGVALGYVGGEYFEYNYCMEDEWWAQQAVHNRKYFGPTRAGISLAWMIGKRNKARYRTM